MNSLSFNTIQFHPIQRNDDEIWITSSELARALGYKQADAVTKIFNRKSDEFTRDMTQMINNPQTPNLGVRIFSLRGCHLITFFARTPVAKEFRKWVLDILDREVQPKTKNHKTERVVLNDAVNMLVAKTKHLNFSDAYKMLHQRFGVSGIDEISFDQIPVAVEYVHHLIALYNKAEKKADQYDNCVHNALCHMLWVSAWWNCYADSLRMLNPKMAGQISDHFSDGAFCASMALNDVDRQSVKEKIVKKYPFHLKRHELQTFLRLEQR